MCVRKTLLAKRRLNVLCLVVSLHGILDLPNDLGDLLILFASLVDGLEGQTGSSVPLGALAERAPPGGIFLLPLCINCWYIAEASAFVGLTAEEFARTDEFVAKFASYCYSFDT